MAEDATVQRVRALCDAASLPVSEEELAELVPLYRLFSEGIERLAAVNFLHGRESSHPGLGRQQHSSRRMPVPCNTPCGDVQQN